MGRIAKGLAAAVALAGTALAVFLAVFYVSVVRSRVPSNDRDWTPAQARLATAEFRGDTVIIRNFRRFRYEGRDRTRETWSTDTVHLSRLRSVMYALAPFGPQWTGSAHSFVTFAFTDSQFVSISAEARRERGERFGVVKGLTRGMELIYVVGDENDVVRRRVVDGDDIYLYPINSPYRRTRELFVAMLRRANELATTPEFYNLATNNCTSVLIDHVNTIIPGRIPSGWQTMLPGYADRVAERIELLGARGTVASLRARYKVNPIAATLADDASFSIRLHERLGDAPIAGDSAHAATVARVLDSLARGG